MSSSTSSNAGQGGDAAAYKSRGRVTSITIDGTELREVDEIDSKAFTMYSLTVSATDHETKEVVTWNLQRRYSQFYELMTELTKKYGKSVKALPFPPKVTIGNLAPKVVGHRRQGLGNWINAVATLDDHPEISECAEVLAFLEAREGIVTPGSTLPDISFTDLYGRQFSLKALARTHVLVLSAASRYNFQKMTQWIAPAQESLLRKYPGLKVAFISVADLRPVPGPMRGTVTKVLKKVDAKTLASNATAAGGSWNATALIMCVDWTGQVLHSIGAEDANWTYRVSIAAGGVVVKCIQSSTRDPGLQYAAAFEEIMQGQHDLRADEAKLATAATAAVQAAELRIKAKKSHETVVTVPVDAVPCWLAYEVGTSKNSVAFAIARSGDGGECILPVRKISAAADSGSSSSDMVPSRGLVSIMKGGEFTCTLKNEQLMGAWEGVFRAFVIPMESADK